MKKNRGKKSRDTAPLTPEGCPPDFHWFKIKYAIHFCLTLVENENCEKCNEFI